MIPVIDLFAGPGGLGEGFSCLQSSQDKRVFKIVLSIEKDKCAHETLRLRSFYRQFLDSSAVPDEYYAVLRGKADWGTLLATHPAAAKAADAEAWNAELGKISRTELNRRIKKALGAAEEWVLIGGPPCQAYSLVGRSRRKSITDYIPEKDERNTLYIHYLQTIADHWPTVFVMENVKGILSHTYKENSIFQQILSDLRDPNRALGVRGKGHRYRIVSLVSPSKPDSLQPGDYIVRAELFGIPQKRHRVILIGIREDLGEVVPDVLQERPPVAVKKVIDDLPRLRSGISKASDSAAEWVKLIQDATDRRWFKGVREVGGDNVERCIRQVAKSICAPPMDRGGHFLEGVSTGCAYMPQWFSSDERLGGISGHITRSHITADLYRYLYCSCFAEVRCESPGLQRFPAYLLPKHANVKKKNFKKTPFKDRFTVQVAAEPATTITSHISKDGHYYIHPDPSQCRSLTVREAARVQTFPDNYHFLGPRTSQYAQVGNAVPPLLARQIAERIAKLLGR